MVSERERRRLEENLVRGRSEKLNSTNDNFAAFRLKFILFGCGGWSFYEEGCFGTLPTIPAQVFDQSGQAVGTAYTVS